MFEDGVHLTVGSQRAFPHHLRVLRSSARCLPFVPGYAVVHVLITVLNCCTLYYLLRGCPLEHCLRILRFLLSCFQFCESSKRVFTVHDRPLNPLTGCRNYCMSTVLIERHKGNQNEARKQQVNTWKKRVVRRTQITSLLPRHALWLYKCTLLRTACFVPHAPLLYIPQLCAQTTHS